MTTPPPVGKVDPDVGAIDRQNSELERTMYSKVLDLGLIGRLFGAAAEKPGNVAGVIVLLSFGLFAYVVLTHGNDSSMKDAIATIAGFVTLGLGFLFGRSTS